MGREPKRALSLTRQVARLKERGLVIDDDERAEQYLYDTNYYRLAGFARQFQADPARGDNTFAPGTTLDQLSELVAADAQFARLLSDALAVLECVVRSRFALQLALAHGEKAFYLDRDAYVDGLDAKIDSLIEDISRDLARDKGRTVARYAPGRDFSQVPVWVAIELLSFGTLSKMMELLDNKAPRDAVAHSFFEQRGTFTSTIHSLAVLRNRCAHHGQIWHRRLTIQTPTSGKHRHQARVKFHPQGPFAAVLAVRRMLTRGNVGAAQLAALDAFMTAADPAYMDGIYNPAPK